ncbi:LacI family DNA-binding transcriptional regulator [Bacillaceae bacterium CLA-AA-H227]|uniref:LacI family DNA-binding transcriptional regulator n=1 Tax=Robertmurraya yapensis (ex Hitch et al 2024) TaxID=3133160 RepID=A0ACC6SGG0_9BACI
MVTIKDIAKMANVSVATVSNALNGKESVKPKTKEQILKLAKELNYVPNSIAQGLVKNSTKTINIVISGPSSFNLFSNPNFFQLVRSITIYLDKIGYYVLLSIIDMDEELQKIPRIAQSRSSDALILLGSRRSNDELIAMINRINIPTLVIDRGTFKEDIVTVSVDNQKCTYLATRHLLEMGHRRIGFLGEIPGYRLAEERLEGYRQALDEEGIPYDESIVIKGDYYQESGLVGIRQLLAHAVPRPTAVTIANDLMALGAIEGIEQEGLRIPEDISIIGCDNIPNLHLLKVPLSTVSIPFSEIGRLAAKKAVGILEGNDQLPRQIMLTPELRIRSSVNGI